jgi:selenocysteine lyase/cysteine desulfurase
MDDRLVPAGDFDLAPGYLNTASIGVPPRPALDALRAAVDEWGSGHAQAPAYDEPVQRAREAFARIVHADAADVAIGPQVSVFTAQVLNAIPTGAEVVAYRGDFTSVLFPLLARRDLDVRLVDRVADLADAIGPGTALVAVSAAQSADGAVADLAAIESAAAEHDALTYIDTTQSAGWLPIEATRFDFVAAGGYKWLLSPRGTAFMAVRPDRIAELVPIAPGWYAGDDRWDSIYGPPLRLASDARKYDISPAWLNWVGTAAALEYLETIGIESIYDHDVDLANRLRAAVGMPEAGSAIVSVTLPGDPDRLTQAGLRTAVRDGRLRASFHLYNTEADVDLLVEALRPPV